MMSFAPLLRWFTPRTTDPNLKFREKTIRTILPLMILLSILAFIASVVAFNAKWTLFSYQTAEIVATIILIASGIAIHRGKITVSGYLMVSTFVFFSTFVFLTGPSFTNADIMYYVLTMVVVALVMPLSSIYIFGAISGGLILFSVLTSGAITANAGVVINAVIILGVVSILLYNLRKEYDDKLLDAQASRRETEQALKIAELKSIEAERANNAKSSFLSTMSHELRTPLGAIIGFIGILENNMIKPKEEARELSGTQKKMIKDIKYNAESLLTLINGILDLTRVSSGRIQANLVPINPNEETFINGTVQSLRSLAISKNIELELQFDSNVPQQVNCDVPQVKQVVKNLVGNAIKFTDNGKVSVHIGALGTDKWQIVVKDSGIGVKPDALKHIFEPFYQADSTDTRAREGTGLGLAIAKSYVELHQGTLVADSTYGVGTTFTIQMPLKPQPAQVAQLSQTSVVPQLAQPVPAAQPATKPFTSQPTPVLQPTLSAVPQPVPTTQAAPVVQAAQPSQPTQPS